MVLDGARLEVPASELDRFAHELCPALRNGATVDRDISILNDEEHDLERFSGREQDWPTCAVRRQQPHPAW
jgi:hypothetical protein